LNEGAARLPQPRSLRRYAIAASIGLLCVAAGVFGWSQRGPAYATDIGEQRKLKLPDGSLVELNSRSRIRVRYSQTARIIDLLEGQALFQVYKDVQRPFLVRSDTAQVRAIGTQFDVYRKSTGTIVTVVEGKVAVFSSSPPPLRGGGEREGASSNAIPLAAGEQLILSPDKPSRPTRTNVTAATSWTRGQLMFKSTPLSAVVEEFNRYNTRRLVLRDSVEDFPITAVFSSTDPRALVEFLKGEAGVSVETSSDEILIK
jgi:transmembrane sensor